MSDQPLNPAEIAIAASIMLEENKGAVAAMTGLRNQYIAAGWSQHDAEQMVVAMMYQAKKS